MPNDVKNISLDGMASPFTIDLVVGGFLPFNWHLYDFSKGIPQGQGQDPVQLALGKNPCLVSLTQATENLAGHMLMWAVLIYDQDLKGSQAIRITSTLKGANGVSRNASVDLTLTENPQLASLKILLNK